MDARIGEVLTFCVERTPTDAWFRQDDRFDEEIGHRFEAPHLEAAAGALDHWRESPRGCVALCILLDQVPRNIYRGTPRAFATDPAAREVTRHALARGFDRALSDRERLFLYLPLEHSEDIADQEDCVRLMAELGEDPGWAGFARRHRDIIARFGRFPHRNAVLGRPSSAEEIAFLRQPDSSF